MTIYVDKLRRHFGGPRFNRQGKWCHLMTDQKDLTELHDMAKKIGMKRAWFQNHPLHPHYDLTENRRKAAVLLGAVEVGNKEMIRICGLLGGNND